MVIKLVILYSWNRLIIIMLERRHIICLKHLSYGIIKISRMKSV